MKKTLIYSFILLLTLSAPAFAEDASSSQVKGDSTTTIKVDSLATRKQKIESDLRTTVQKLKQAIDRTQTIIDLLNKNGKDTTDASSALMDAQTSLNTASDALDQFSGVIVPETKSTKKGKSDDKATSSLKDPLKKAEDSLKDSKASLILSINSLKDLLSTKDSQ